MSPSSSLEYERVRVLNLLAVPVARWRLVLGFAAAGLVWATLWLIVRPDRYLVQTVIMPSPEVATRPSPLSQYLPRELGLDLSAIIPVNRDVSAVAILESRSVADSLITRLRLDEAWETSSEAARGILQSRTSFERKQDGTLTIHVEDRYPALAAKIANAYPQALNDANARIAAEAAQQRIAFLDRQLIQVRSDLQEAEEHLLDFQRAHGIPIVATQASKAIETAAELQEQVLKSEAEVTQLRRTLTSEHPRLREAESGLNILRGQLARVLVSRASNFSPLPSLQEVPELQVNYTSLARDLRKHEEMYLALSGALAEARLRGASNLPIVAVLDPALPIRRAAGMSPVYLFVLVTGSALFMGILAAFLVEWFQVAQRDPANERFFRAWSDMRRDLAGVMRRRE